MRKATLFKLETIYREPMAIQGYVFGDLGAERSCAIVGSLRGNEIQQDYICANLVQVLKQVEERGIIAPGKSILVVPCANPFSMNVSKRFWPTDSTDINRMFPGNSKGETTERVAAGLFDVVSHYSYGMQLASFFMPGDFMPHVRVTRAGRISNESLAMADAFGLPYVIANDPNAFDTTMLNYNWQRAGAHAFSLYSRVTDTIDPVSAQLVERAVLRFLGMRGILKQGASGIARPTHLEESQLVNVRTEKAGGFFLRKVAPGDHVEKGQVLAEVTDTLDCHVRETLRSPLDGVVFFSRVASVVEQDIICFRIAPEQ